MLIRSRVGGGSPLSGVLDDMRMPLHLPHLLTSPRTGSLGAGACDAGDMPWLVMEGRVLASAELTAGRRDRARGLLGRDGHEGALVLQRCRWVHTIGMRFPIDVAYLDADGVVLKTVRMRQHRIGLPVPKARTVVEAEAGAFSRWGIHAGDVVELKT
jgi:uncharacterized membrane protein (UPF0127 family)